MLSFLLIDESQTRFIMKIETLSLKANKKTISRCRKERWSSYDFFIIFVYFLFFIIILLLFLFILFIYSFLYSFALLIASK